jgi:ABC-type nitrate/sulfonate/bicarbonate transport system permease component
MFDRVIGATVVAVLLASLEIAVRSGAVNAVLAPPPSVIAQRTYALIANGTVLQPLMQTLYLLFLAYFIACAIAIALGLLMGRFEAIHNLFEPVVESLRPLPKAALLPPLMMLLGLGDAMKLAVVGLAVFFPVLINTVQGVRGVDPVLINTARTFGHAPGRILRNVILPASLPFILSGMRVGLGLGLILVTTAEMMAGTGGVGYLIIDMQRSFRVQNMYAWIVILAVLGYALNVLFLKLEHRATHWASAKSS